MSRLFSYLRLWCAAALSAFILFVPYVASAATTVTNAYDQPTTLATSASGNHHLSLTLNGTWNEGATLTLTFESGFTISSLTEDDIDIADDTIDLTTAADCSGAEQASVVRSSQTITFTLCAGDGGTVASGSVVDVEIGLNASASGTASSQIQNPATEGTYYINIGGTLGQMGSIPVPIIGADATSVSAVVSGGSEPPDTGCTTCGGTENSITVESPNGGEEYDAGDTVTLAWATTGGGISSVNLFYSTDGGETYTAIVGATTNDGFYTWIAPDIDTTQALIYAQGTDGIDIVDTDASNDFFTIHGSSTLTVLSPNGGESYLSGDEVSVEWATTGTAITELAIFYSEDSGRTFTLLSEGEVNDGTYRWTTTEGLEGSQFIIKVIGSDGTEEKAFDISDDVFSFSAPVASSFATLLAPNGGEVIEAESTTTITWETSADVDSIDLSYSLDGGATYTIIVTGEANDGSYLWTVPLVSSTEALISLRARDTSVTLTDISDAVFTITLPFSEEDTLTVLSPNGGETIAGGSVTSVTWSTSGRSITSVSLSYSLDGGATYTEFASDTEDDGSYSWAVPSVATTQALIRVIGVDGTTAYATDTSDTVFTITTEDIPPLEPEETTPTVALRFLVAQDLLSLIVDGDAVDVLAGEPVHVIADLSSGTGVQSVVFSYLDAEYTASLLSETSWGAFVTVSGSETAPLGAVVTYTDGTVLTATYTLTMVNEGEVYETLEGEQTPISNAVILIYETTSGLRTQWNAATYGFSNPDISGEDGGLGWYVPNGTYVVTAGKSGYEDAEDAIIVWNNILTPGIEMSRTEEVVLPPETTTEAGTPPVSSSANPPVQESSSTQTLIAHVVNGIAGVQEAFASPAIQTTADIATPVAVFSVATGGILLLSFFDLLPLLQYFFSAPVLFFARRRRQAFGVVYNGMTKVPVDLAIVRLLNASGKILRTMVTDKEGRYFFKVDPGVYFLSVMKRGFVFPSTYVGSIKGDGKYLDVYTGGEIQATQQDALITANIPIDPADAPKKHQISFLRFGRFLRLFQEIVALSGVVASLAVAIVRPSLWTIGLCLLNVGIYLAVRLFVRTPKPKGWGIVFHEQKRKTLGNVVVRLFEPKYNKLIESTLTDRQGRYAFLVGPNEYYVTFEKEGFKKSEVRPIDFTKNTAPELLSVDVSMSKGDSEV